MNWIVSQNYSASESAEKPEKSSSSVSEMKRLRIASSVMAPVGASVSSELDSEEELPSSVWCVSNDLSFLEPVNNNL